MGSYRTVQQLAGPCKDFVRKVEKGGSMKPQHLNKPLNDEADTTQAAIPEQTMSDGLRARIAKRAYELYLERGCRPGCDLEDWVDAEREVLESSIS